MLTDFVNPFCGSGNALLPRPGGLCARWFFIKAQCGNNTPHAALPFAMLTAGAYSGGYSSGYGCNAPNYNGHPPRLMAQLAVSGFTHFHHSGTGAIESYYNYFRVTPLCGALRDLDEKIPVTQESAVPGCYNAALENGIRASLSVGEMYAVHRYEFPQPNGSIAVDFAQAGLDKSFGARFFAVPQNVLAQRLSASEAAGHMRLYGLTLYVHILCPAARESVLFCGREETAGERQMWENPQEQTGVLFRLGERRTAEITLGVSFHSAEKAAENARKAAGFADTAENAAAQWEGALQAIKVETADDTLKRTFYSQLYHSLIKPARVDDPSPFAPRESYYMDFATLWDQYKTQLPLVIAFYPQRAAQMLQSLVDFGQKHGSIPCAILFNNRTDFCDMQARMLAAYFACSAYRMGIGGVDYRQALAVMLRDLRHERNRDFLETGITQRYTHILDLADACYYLAALAGDLGEAALQTELQDLSGHWRKVYDAESGLLSGESDYYEGTAANYSFRLLHDMPARMALFASPADFEAALDRFFGFGEEEVGQQENPQDIETMWRGMALGRFEGYNNEPDMETPYNYIFAGRHGKLCEILTAGMRELFSDERVGLPGNNDSGGLSSCYVWNTLGIFPAFASGLYLLGRPFFDCASLQVAPGKTLTIRARNLSEKAIYVKKILRNGRELHRFWLTAQEFCAGGELEFVMCETPANTADFAPPPKP